MEIGFKIENQTLTQVRNMKPANKSQEFLSFKFDFVTDDWEDLTKFALFSYHGTKYRIGLTNDECIVPNAVLQGDRFSFSVYGVDNENVRATTNRIVIYLSDSGYTTDVENDIPSDDPTVVEQIYLDIDAAKSEAESYADTGLALKVDKSTYNTKIEELETGKSNIGHTHTESDITDLKEYSEVGHTHTKSDVTDFTHTHTKSDITDFSHTHDDRYYTEDEVNAIINALQNSIAVNGDKTIIQTDENLELYSYIKENGIPQLNKKVHFYKKMGE